MSGDKPVLKEEEKEKKVEEVENEEISGPADTHVTPKKKKDKKKNKNSENNNNNNNNALVNNSVAEKETLNQIELAISRFGLQANSKVKKQKENHAFWDTQPVPKKSMPFFNL